MPEEIKKKTKAKRPRKNKKSVKKSNSDFIGGLVIGSLFVFIVYGLSSSPNDEIEVSTISERPELDTFWEVWDLIDDRYKGVPGKELPDDEERIQGAIEGLARSLDDPYSTFLPTEESEQFTNDVVFGSFEGIGIYIESVDGNLTIVSPLSGTPAERAGLKGKDLITKIDGEPSIGITTREAAQKIRGERGTTVTLTIFRQGVSEPFDVDVTRDKVDIPSVETEIVDGVFVISIKNFSILSIDKFRDALRSYVRQRQTNDGLIIDLRNNPGGLLESAIEMSSFFLPINKKILSQSTDKSGPSWKIHRSKGYNVFEKLGIEPTIAVLVNGGTASSSEILAGALQDHNIATIIGETTFGKGSVQELIKLDDDSSLKVTVAHWRTPSDNFISEVGIKPDIEINDDQDTEEDEQLQEAVRFIKNSQ